MDFKTKKLIPLLSVCCFLNLIGCVGDSIDPDGEYKIGEKLEQISDLSGETGGASSAVVIFDETTRRLLQFDLVNMKLTRSLSVLNPTQKHYVLFHEQGNYSIDLSSKHLTVFNVNGIPNHNPVSFFGTPISAAFRPDLGFVVIYDDLQSVVLLHIDDTGSVIGQRVQGAVTSNNATIVSGDISDSGELILGLSDGSISQVDIAQSIATQSWVEVNTATTLTDIKWIGPVSGAPDELLIRAKDKIAFYSLATHSIVTEVAFDEEKSLILKYSKRKDPHIIIRPRRGYREMLVYYIQASQLKTKSVFLDRAGFLTSQLDLTTDKWTIVRSSSSDLFFTGYLNETRFGRSLLRYSFSSLLATQAELRLPDNTKGQLAPDFIFALFPSELGFAQRISIDSGATKDLRMFNLDALK